MVKSGKFVKLLDSQDFCKILRRKIVKSEEIGKLSISGARGQWVLCSLPCMSRSGMSSRWYLQTI